MCTIMVGNGRRRDAVARGASLMAGVSILCFAGIEDAAASCVTTGTILSSSCDANAIRVKVGDGESSLAVTDETTVLIEFSPFSDATTPVTQTLEILGATVVNNDSYSAVYSQTGAPARDISVEIGEEVSITSAGGGFGAVWMRNEVSGDISITSAATVTAYVGPGISATTNDGSVTIDNSGEITSTSDWGIYGDGGYNTDPSTPALVSLINSGTVTGHLAGMRSINYQGLASITNSGTVTSETRQALVAWSADGDASITNSGTAIARDDIALVAWSETGDVTVVNSGSLQAYDDTDHTDSGAGHHGIQTLVGASGKTTITNTVTGTIEAPAQTGILATSASGDISIGNAGLIEALDGISAQADDGAVWIDNSGTIDATRYGVVLSGNGSTLVNMGSISGGTASVFFAQGGNTLSIAQGSEFSGVVDYNSTTGNTTAFGAGSYRIPAANYIDGSNAITLDSASQVVVLADADTSGTINVIAAVPVKAVTSQYTGLAASVLGGILSLDIDRPEGTGNPAELAYGDVGVEQSEAFSKFAGGTTLDHSGNLVWARAFGGGYQRSASDGEGASTGSNYGVIAGMDRASDGIRLGFFVGAGYAAIETDDGSSELEGQTGFVGIYGSARVDELVLAGSLAVGGMNTESRRAINGGTEWASGDFLGWYLSPELALSQEMRLSEGWSLTPSARLRYVGAFYEGFAEQGSSQNITYGSRDAHTLEGRMQLEATRRIVTASGTLLKLSASGAILDIHDLGGDGIQASLDGTEFRLADASEENVFGVGFGASFDLGLSATTNIYGAVEGAAFTDDSESWAGRLGVKTAF